jgi:GT2 family glycosyltransferase
MKVVVLSFNHAGITKDCLLSVLNLFNPVDVFLVHNGSKATSIDELKLAFPQIHHLILEKNLGFSGGANFGFKNVFDLGADRVLFLSNDTKLKKFSKQNQGDLIALDIELRSTKRRHSFGGMVNFSKGLLSHITTLEDHSQDPHFYVPGSAFIISREAWQKTNGFDENLGSYWEDVDLSLRARKLNLKLAVAQNLILTHGVAKTTGNNPYYTTYLYHRNQRLVILRHGTVSERIAFLGVYTFRIMGKLFKYLRNKDFERAKLILKALVV